MNLRHRQHWLNTIVCVWDTMTNILVNGRLKAWTNKRAPLYRAKDGDVVRRWTIMRHGVALESRLDISSDIKEGQHIEIKLGGWQVTPYPLYLIFPERRLIDPLFNVVKEYLIDCVQNVLA